MNQQGQRLQRFQQAVQSHGSGQSGQSGSGQSSQWQSGQGGTATLQQRQVMSWSQIQQPGTYVEEDTGDIYRVPPQGLANGQMPIIDRESTRVSSSFIFLSPNPFLPSGEAVALAQEAVQALQQRQQSGGY